MNAIDLSPRALGRGDSLGRPVVIDRPHLRAGFTLVEVLTVIGILVILMAILLPVVSSVRRHGQEADTTSELSKIAVACSNYFHDYNAYPGPLADPLIFGFNNSATPATLPLTTDGTSTPLPQAINCSQNLTLGLLGGLRKSTSGPTSVLDLTLIPNGPRELSPTNPKQLSAYFDPPQTDLRVANGQYSSDIDNPIVPTGAAAGFPTKFDNGSGAGIPEILDHFPLQHPIIYLRARAGHRTMVDSFMPTVNPPPAPDPQYWSMEMSPFTYPNPAFSTTAPKDPNNNNTVLYPYPQDFFVNPTLGTPVSGTPQTISGDQLTPRGKDSFILISAGYDGIFGTKDDIIISN